MTILDERACVPRALAIARALDHPIYDCVYLAMAEMDDRVLITADSRFAGRVRASRWSRLLEVLE